MRVVSALLAVAHAAKYLLVTTPENSPEKVWYMVLPTLDAAASTVSFLQTKETKETHHTTKTLKTDQGGLRTPASEATKVSLLQTKETATETTDADDSTTDASDTSTTETSGITDTNRLQALLKDDDALSKPIGIAVDHARNGLYVADYASGKILRWTIAENTDLQTLSVTSKPTEIYSGSYVSWLAVDSIGNLFFSDEDTSTIWKVSAEDLITTSRAKNDTYYASGAYNLNCPGVYGTDRPTPVVVYSREDTKTSEVSGPGGLAVDNFHVFWGNKQLGTQVGSIVKGYETSTPDKVKQPVKIALNTERVYGICLAGNNIYYTDKRTNIYGVKKHGGGIATISESMKDPRGCAWDGDGTIYVADMGEGKVKSFPSNMLNLAPQKLKDVVDVMQPMSLAVFETPVSTCAFAALRYASAAVVLFFALQ